MGKPTHLKWAWVYGGVEVDEFDSLDEAVSAAEYASDTGAESFWCIEEIGKGVVDPELVDRMRDEISQRSIESYRSQPKPTRRVEILSPKRDERGVERWAALKWIYDGATDAALAEAAEHYGADRVRVVRTSA